MRGFSRFPVFSKVLAGRMNELITRVNALVNKIVMKSIIQFIFNSNNNKNKRNNNNTLQVNRSGLFSTNPECLGSSQRPKVM